MKGQLVSYMDISSLKKGGSKVNPCPPEPRYNAPVICPISVNIVDPDQLASEEANWSGSALCVIQLVYLYQQSR